jgi:FixJ family two-component response regulator
MAAGGAVKTATVVVVDNNAPMRVALQRLLKAAGYEVDTHASAESFLQSGRLSSTDCLLLDVRMSGMSGVELQEDLDRLGAKIPIVFMTGSADANVRSRALSSKVVELLEKPFSDEALLGAIERALRAGPR